MNRQEVQDGGDLGRRIDTLIFIELDQRFPLMTEKIEKLAEAGLGSGEIARIVAKPSRYVAAALSKGKKRKGRAKGQNEGRERRHAG
jgi:uncharacterized protein YoaH (UPF0181 family)